MKFAGRVQRFGDNINTDYIIAAHHKASAVDMREIAQHTFETIDPGFVGRVRRGDILVAGRNFGCGSSRETAVHVLAIVGISCVVAVSFARIFFRNAINNGLPLAECDTTQLDLGDVEVDLERGEVTQGELRLAVKPLPGFMRAIVEAGGLAEYVAQHGDLVLPTDVR